MAQFKVGGKVVCIRTLHLENNHGDSVTVKKGLVYTVRAIASHEGCRVTSLDIGFPAPGGAGSTTKCYKCGMIWANGGSWFIRSVVFVPIEETEFKQVTFEKIINEIPVSAQ